MIENKNISRSKNVVYLHLPNTTWITTPETNASRLTNLPTTHKNQHNPSIPAQYLKHNRFQNTCDGPNTHYCVSTLPFPRHRCLLFAFGSRLLYLHMPEHQILITVAVYKHNCTSHNIADLECREEYGKSAMLFN